MDLITALIAGIAALIGGYFGTRWAFGKYLQERQFEELVIKRDILKDFLADHADFNDFFQMCAEGQISEEMGKDLLGWMDKLSLHFINDTRIISILDKLTTYVEVGLNGRLRYSDQTLITNLFSELNGLFATLQSVVQGEQYEELTKSYASIDEMMKDIENQQKWWKFWK